MQAGCGGSVSVPGDGSGVGSLSAAAATLWAGGGNRSSSGEHAAVSLLWLAEAKETS